MNASDRFLSRRLPAARIASLDRWGSYLGAAAVLALTAGYLPRHADQSDLLFGMGAAVVASLLFLIYGTLAGVLPAAGDSEPSGAWIGRSLSYVGCLTVGALALWYLPAFALGEARLVIGLLL